MNINNITDNFIESIDNVFKEKIPEHIIQKAKFSLLDYIAVTLAGNKNLGEKLDFFKKNCDSGEYTAIGFDRKFCLKDAVFLNGLCGHALDLDDGTNTGIIHLGSPIFSVLLPLAEKYKIDSGKFLKAAVIGYETSFTMAVSIQPKHKQMGYHATGTCGVLGIAMAVSYMLDFTAEQKKNAFSAACASASGMLQVLDDGSELKPYNVAKSALLGLSSVQMALAGFVGNPDPLGNYRGFLKMFAGDENVKLKSPMLNGTYAIEKSYTKPYAACRYCHPSIEDAILLRDEYHMIPDDIDSINIRTYDLAVKGHDHVNVPNSFSAKMSIPFGVACGIIYGKAGLQEYDDKHIKDNELLQLTKKVNVISDQECSEKFPDVTTAIMEIKMKSGQSYTKQVDFPKGEPENPLTEEEFDSRFVGLAVFSGKTVEKANSILKHIKNLSDSMEELFEFL